APAGLGGVPLLTPLHGSMVSRYRGGDAGRRSSGRVGLEPTIGQHVVEVGFLLPRPASSRLASLVSRGESRHLTALALGLLSPWGRYLAGHAARSRRGIVERHLRATRRASRASPRTRG